jgi:xanthine dehydrogenase accessory factor
VDTAEPGDAAAVAYAAARSAYDAGRASVVVAHLDARRERVTIDESGAMTGTLGAPLLDERAREIAARRLAGGSPSGVERLTHDAAELSLFFERLAPPETLVIYGASQVRELGMRTVIVDGREQMASRERFPAADEIHVGMPSEIAEQLVATRRTYVVLLAHDYKYELPVLRTVLRSSAGYIGMLGSKRRGASIRAMLEEEGFTAAELSRVRTPIGLAIGSKSAPEIAPGGTRCAGANAD